MFVLNWHLKGEDLWLKPCCGPSFSWLYTPAFQKPAWYCWLAPNVFVSPLFLNNCASVRGYIVKQFLLFVRFMFIVKVSNTVVPQSDVRRNLWVRVRWRDWHRSHNLPVKTTAGCRVFHISIKNENRWSVLKINMLHCLRSKLLLVRTLIPNSSIRHNGIVGRVPQHRKASSRDSKVNHLTNVSSGLVLRRLMLLTSYSW